MPAWREEIELAAGEQPGDVKINFTATSIVLRFERQILSNASKYRRSVSEKTKNIKWTTKNDQHNS